MAFRRRLKNRLKNILRPQDSRIQPAEQPIKVDRAVQQAPPETLTPPPAPSMELRIDAVIEEEDSQQAQTTDVIENAQQPLETSVDSNTAQAISINSTLEEEWESDYISNDSPIRNAHYSTPKKDTSDAVQVIIIDPNDGGSYNFSCEPDEFILDAADRAGRELPFSCRSGGCLVCTGKLQSGSVDMEEQYVLEQEHIENGFILLCCTTPKTDVTIVSHQEDNVE